MKKTELENYLNKIQKKNTVLDPIKDFINLSVLDIKPFTFMRKVVTLKTLINRLLLKPYRTEIIRLDTGLISEIKHYKNKKIIKIISCN